MTPEEHAEFRRPEAENVAPREQALALLARVRELEGRLAKDSHNSSKPSSSDGLKRKPRSLRQQSGKKPGGNQGTRAPHWRGGHAGPGDPPPSPGVWTCQAPLDGPAAERVERRQVRDLPRCG